MSPGDERLFEGQLQIFDVDPYLWPKGVWMPVCRRCRRGPLDNGRVFCEEDDCWDRSVTQVTVVNLRDQWQCAQLKASGRLVRIDRRTKWGNPFVVGTHGDRDEVIARYADYFDNNELLQAHLYELRGMALACWCAPQPCHGDVLVARLQREEQQ